MANIKLTQLSELTTPDNENTIFYVADLSVNPNVSHYMRLGSFTSDENVARLAFAQANDALIVAEYSLNAGWNANIAFHRANAVYAYANTGYTQANNAASFANGAFARANSGYAFANTGYDQSNSASSFANGAFTLANNITGVNITQNTNISSAQSYANSAFNTANSAASFANGSFNRANTSVIKTGDSITGVITAPTAANGTSNTMIATTRFVNSEITNYGGLGIGQTWTNVKTSRANNSTFTNSTNKPIAVYVRSTFGSGSFGSYVVGYVGTTEVAFHRDNGSAGATQITTAINFVVPPGETYKIVQVGSGASIALWHELR